MRRLHCGTISIFLGMTFIPLGAVQHSYGQGLPSPLQVQRSNQSAQVAAEPQPLDTQEKLALSSEISALLQVQSSNQAPQRKKEEESKRQTIALDISAKDEKQLVKLFVNNGKWIDLTWQPDPEKNNERTALTWTMDADEPPLLGMSAVGKGSGCDTGQLNLYDVSCNTQYLLVHESGQSELQVVMKVTTDGLYVLRSLRPILRAHPDWAIAVNGSRISEDQVFPFTIPFDSDAWTIEWFRTYPEQGCRFYSPKEDDREAVNLWPANFAGLTEPNAKNNGIMVGRAKLFDSAALRTMLNATASQLSALSGFNAASITGAFGNLQGLSRDTSFLSAQITTTPLPVVAATNSSGLTGSASNTVSTSTPTTTTGSVTLQCPDGSLPSLSSGSLACGVIATGSQPITWFWENVLGKPEVSFGLLVAAVIAWRQGIAAAWAYLWLRINEVAGGGKNKPERTGGAKKPDDGLS